MKTTPSAKPIRLSYRSIYILPTKRGLGFVLLMTILMLIAFVYNNNLVYLLCFLLASLFFITIVHTVNSLQGLLIKKAQSPDVFAGELTKSALIIDNPGNSDRYSVQLGATRKSMVSCDISAQQSAHVSLAQRANQRGWLVVSRPVISSCYPFGLFRAWNRLNIEIKTLVYPRPGTQVCPLPENSSRQGMQGNAQKGQDDFYGLQDYQAGDGIRHIHWRAYAKGQGLLTRQYTGLQSAEIWLDYEQTLGSDQEERLSQMCRWVLDADKTGVEYGMKLMDLNIAPNRGHEHSTQCLQALALV
ncbi:DUF58 domain-containing protein [Methyloprofundus sp.]|uniref:DUF58 domain-containing protein n=1 Tax=Methyloprofundus sp. TaxID=2020875 RepID=UPI003D0FCDDE